MTDEPELLKRAQAYDPAALAELYDRYAPRMYAYIYRRVSDQHLAEDLTGEIFVRVLRAIQNEQAWKGSFHGWLYRIAHNLVVDHYRRQPLPLQSLDETRYASDDDDPDRKIEETIRQDQLRMAIGRLTPEQQQVLALRFGEGLTARETAQIMEKSVGAIEALQRRATAALRRILAPDGETRT